MDQRKEKNIPYLDKHEIVLMVEEIEALQHMLLFVELHNLLKRLSLIVKQKCGW